VEITVSTDLVIDSISELLETLRYEELPGDVVHAAKRVLVDTIGCAFGGHQAPAAVAARAIAEAVRPTPHSPRATVLIDNAATSPDLAAFANGVMLRVLDFNDSFHGKGNGGHPSDVIAGVLAAAESTHSSGEALLLGVVSAYEVFCRYVGQTRLGANPWDHVTVGALAVAGAAGRLMKLSKSQLRDALALALVPNMALRATRFEEVSMWKGCAAANASRNGLFAATAAANGVTGPPRPFEGRGGAFSGPVPRFEPPEVADDSAHSILLCQFKRFPIGSLSQTAASAALEIHEKRLAVDDIDRIHLGTTGFAMSVMAGDAEKWRPTTRESADHSLPFVVASTIRDGAPGVHSLDHSAFTDPALQDLMDRVEVSVDAECEAAAPVTMANLTVTLRTGEKHTVATRYHRGHYRNAMTDAEIADKFIAQTAPVIGARPTTELLDTLWDIDRQSDIGSLIAATAGPRS
jgi:2-methylcitrate dehydratase